MNVVTISVENRAEPISLSVDPERVVSVSVHTETPDEFRAAVAALGGLRAGKLDGVGDTVWFSVDVGMVGVDVHAPKLDPRPVPRVTNPALEAARAILEDQL